MKTILRFASVSLKIIKTDLLGSWWPCQCVLPPKDVNRSSVIAKHVHRWFPVTVASQALTGQTIGRYTLWVLGFIENRLGKPSMQTLRQWFWRRSRLLEADAYGVSLRCSRALLLSTTSRQQRVCPSRNFGLEVCSLHNCDFSLSQTTRQLRFLQ
jgi:hypothetical protein